MARRRKGANLNPEPPREQVPVAPASSGSVISSYSVWLSLISSLAGFYGLYQLFGLAGILEYPLDANFGEGVIWAESRWLRAGQWPYFDSGAAPFWVGTYPPLVQCLGAVGMFPSNSLVFLRLAAVVASLGCALSVGSIAEYLLPELGDKVGKTIETSMVNLTVALWLSSPFIAEWHVLARVDMPGRLLSSLAVALACLGLFRVGGRRWPWLAGSVFAATLAMAAKQTMVSGGAVAAALLATASARNTEGTGATRNGGADLRRTTWVAGAVYMSVWLGSVAVGAFALNAATGGRFLANTIRDTASRNYDFSILAGWTWGFVSSHPGLLVAASIGAWRLVGTPSGAAGIRTRTLSRALLLSLAAGIAMLVLAGNDGVDRNYFFDLLWPLVALAAVGAAPPGTASTKPERIAIAMAGSAVLVQLVLQIAFGGAAIPSTPQKSAATGLATRLAAIPPAAGPLLAEFPGHAIVSGRQPEYLPYMLARMEKAGRFDPAPVVAKLDRRAYAAVILSPRTASGRFSPAIMAAIEHNYAVADPTRDLYKDMYCADGPCDLVWLSPIPKK